MLMQNGYPPVIVAPKDRLKYINSLEKAQLGKGEEDYAKLMYKLLDKSLNLYIRALNQEVADEPNFANSKLMKIGELSKKTDIAVSTLRHWIKIGLVEVAQTTPSGYQMFGENAISQISKIIELKEQRYLLEEIVEKTNKG